MVQKYNDQQNKDLDQGWAWVIMIAATGIIMINAILLYATGVLHVALLEKFEEDNAYTSLIGSIYSSLFSFAGRLLLKQNKKLQFTRKNTQNEQTN